MNSCISQVIQILGCTHLGGAYPMFCYFGTNLLLSEIYVIMISKNFVEGMKILYLSIGTL